MLSLERESRERMRNSDFVSGNIVNGGIYHHDMDKERRHTVVSVVGEEAGAGQTGVAPPNQAVRPGFLMRCSRQRRPYSVEEQHAGCRPMTGG